MAGQGQKQRDLLGWSNCHSEDRGRCLSRGGSGGVCKQSSDKEHIFQLKPKEICWLIAYNREKPRITSMFVAWASELNIMPWIKMENDEVWAGLGGKIKCLVLEIWGISSGLSCQVKVRWVRLEVRVDFRDSDLNLYLEVNNGINI